MKIGYAIVAFVTLHLVLRALGTNKDGSEVPFYFWPALFALGVYLL